MFNRYFYINLSMKVLTPWVTLCLTKQVDATLINRRLLHISESGLIPLLCTLVERKNIKNPPKKQHNKAGYPKISKQH